MPPTPTPTDEDIDDTREVAGELDTTFVTTLIDNLNDAKWAKALDFITAWREYPAGDTIMLEGGREGVNYADERSREDIRVRMRLLLGLPEQRNVGITGYAASVAVATRWTY